MDDKEKNAEVAKAIKFPVSSFSFPSIINGLLIAGQIPSAVLQDTGLRQNHKNSALSV